MASCLLTRFAFTVHVCLSCQRHHTLYNSLQTAAIIWKTCSNSEDYIYPQNVWGKVIKWQEFYSKVHGNYAQRKILFRDTKWLLSIMSYRGRDDQAVWACAVAVQHGRPTVNLHRGRVTKRYSFFMVRGCETFWNLQKNEGSVWRHRTFTCLNLWKNIWRARIFQMTTR